MHDNPGAGISLDLAFNHNVISNAVLTANDLGIFMRASRDNQFYNISIREQPSLSACSWRRPSCRPRKAGSPRRKPNAPKTPSPTSRPVNCGGAAFRVNNTTCTNNVIIRPRFDGNVHGGLSLAAAGFGDGAVDYFPPRPSSSFADLPDIFRLQDEKDEEEEESVHFRINPCNRKKIFGHSAALKIFAMLEFKNKILFVGYGAVAQCALPILVKHLKTPAKNITVMDFEDRRGDAGAVAQARRASSRASA